MLQKNIKRCWLCLSLTLILTSSLFSQITVKSTLIENKGKHPIPFANIYIEGTSIGVISNMDGYFELYIPNEYEGQDIVFSSLGYSIKKIKALELLNINSIELLEKTTSLDEVLLQGKGLDVNALVVEAFGQFYANFPVEPHISRGFVRHVDRTENEYNWLVEAAIDMYDPGYDKSPEDIKFNVKKTRKAYDKRKLILSLIYEDYAVHKLGMKKSKSSNKIRNRFKNASSEEIKKAIAYSNQFYNLPDDGFGYKKNDLRYDRRFFYKLFKTDNNIIRNFGNNSATLDSETLLKKFSFSLDTVIEYDKDVVYKVKISKPLSPYKKYGKKVDPLGFIYIKSDTKAILELQYSLKDISKHADFLVEYFGTDEAFNLHLKFIEINKKMYLNYYRYEQRNGFSSLIAPVGKDKKVFKVEEFIFTEIITDQNKIATFNREDWNDHLFENTEDPFDAEFWKKYNIIADDKEYNRLVQELQNKVDDNYIDKMIEGQKNDKK